MMCGDLRGIVGLGRRGVETLLGELAGAGEFARRLARAGRIQPDELHESGGAELADERGPLRRRRAPRPAARAAMAAHVGAAKIDEREHDARAVAPACRAAGRAPRRRPGRGGRSRPARRRWRALRPARPQRPRVHRRARPRLRARTERAPARRRGRRTRQARESGASWCRAWVCVADQRDVLSIATALPVDSAVGSESLGEPGAFVGTTSPIVASMPRLVWRLRAGAVEPSLTNAVTARSTPSTSYTPASSCG